MNGTNNTATSKDTASVMVIVHGKACRKSLNIPVIVIRNGKKVMLIASVADRMDLKNSFVLAIDACQRDIPSSSFSR